MIEAIISGGQTGADQGGLKAAREIGLGSGGYAPLGWRTEAGPAPWLEEMGLIQSDSDDYRDRTKQNVLLADATVIFGKRSPGSNRTEEECRIAGKPMCWIMWPATKHVLHQGNKGAYYIQPNVRSFFLWLARNNYPKILNVAGNRESKNPGIGQFVTEFLVEAISAQVPSLSR